MNLVTIGVTIAVLLITLYVVKLVWFSSKQEETPVVSISGKTVAEVRQEMSSPLPTPTPESLLGPIPTATEEVTAFPVSQPAPVVPILTSEEHQAALPIIPGQL